MRKMRYRYYSEKHPLMLEDVPHKDRYQVVSHSEPLFFNETVKRFAWGYAEYKEPLTDAEAEHYDLWPEELYEFTHTYLVTHDQAVKLHQILTYWQNNGWSKNDTIEDVFDAVMRIGSQHLIDEQIDSALSIYKKEERDLGCSRMRRNHSTETDRVL